MALKVVTRTVFRCECYHCGHKWDAPKKPGRCANCKKRTWNEGEDNRFKDPYQGVREREADRRPRKVPVPQVPARFQIERGKEAPSAPRIKDIVALFTKARTFFDEIIQNNPCDHPKGECMCADDKETLVNIDNMIGRLKRLMGKNVPQAEMEGIDGG